MDKTIDIYVNGSYIKKNNNTAGVQGEGNATTLHIIFDNSWADMAKSITYWDSRGENPVTITLTNELLVDLTVSLLEYNTKIPAEPMAYEGKLTFVIDGYVSGVRQRSVQDTLYVKPALQVANQPVDPTPTQAEQLQSAIEAILPDVQAETIKAETAASAAETSANNAETSATAAASSAQQAASSASSAASSEASALGSASSAAASANAAEASANTAEAKATEATNQALLSKSYAVGGTGARTGEDTDNSKYYCEQAELASGKILVDDVTGKKYTFGVENGKLYYMEVTE